jgi:RimJ/RimL family protein N-acetyltransferase
LLIDDLRFGIGRRPWNNSPTGLFKLIGWEIMIAIETMRLLLRNFGSDDAEPLREMILQKESSEYAIYDYEWPTSLDEIQHITAWFASEDHYMAVCLKETGKLIGYIGLNPAQDKESKVFDLGYCFNSDYHGQIYASEACRAVIEYAFSGPEADSLTCGTAAANGPSCRLIDRLGFKKIGEETISFRKTPDGKSIEFTGFGFAMSRDEWVGSKPK